MCDPVVSTVSPWRRLSKIEEWAGRERAGTLLWAYHCSSFSFVSNEITVGELTDRKRKGPKAKMYVLCTEK